MCSAKAFQDEFATADGSTKKKKKKSATTIQYNSPNFSEAIKITKYGAQREARAESIADVSFGKVAPRRGVNSTKAARRGKTLFSGELAQAASKGSRAFNIFLTDSGAARGKYRVQPRGSDEELPGSRGLGVPLFFTSIFSLGRVM